MRDVGRCIAGTIERRIGPVRAAGEVDLVADRDLDDHGVLIYGVIFGVIYGKPDNTLVSFLQRSRRRDIDLQLKVGRKRVDVHVGDGRDRDALWNLLETVDRDAQLCNVSRVCIILVADDDLRGLVQLAGTIQRVQFAGRESVAEAERGLVKLKTVA